MDTTVKKKKSKKKLIKKLVIFFIIMVIITAFSLFESSHSYCYKYNNWWIIGNSMENIRERYGEFDYGRYTLIYGGGKVGYKAYVDRLGLRDKQMYYFIYYDENGIATRVNLGELP